MIRSDESQHDRMRHHADELAKLAQTEHDLQQSHEHNGGEQILDAVLHHQCHHHHGHSAGRARNHARTATDHGRNQAHHEGSIETDQRMDVRHQGEGDSFWHQGQCYGQAAQRVDPGFRRGHIEQLRNFHVKPLIQVRADTPAVVSAT